ncbi:CoA transferase [Chelativorans sp. AA-79]|uniref:CoA transferase n=1 Tax=Chelativorans sp. AA-79 TaxID=3028735 RepID=UPI0023F85151|nr:CoA transferase [Chelativorans sp. AA-79]WEX12451.1 CoA transferase [Chelativorans sp. AA-79]
MHKARQPGPLAGLRVLDASGEEGAYAGKLFADMGADVTRLAPSPTAPGAADIFLNLGKTRLIAEPDTREGIDLFCSRLREVDIVIESFRPGLLETFGLSRAELMRQLPELIWAKISPFGTEGPYKAFRSTDLTNMALGGMLTLAGYPDREPVLAYGNQSHTIASLYCGVGVLIAYYERLTSAKGQYIEIPIQHAVATALENSIQFHDLQKVVRKRIGAGYAEAASGLFNCRDGSVFLMAGRLSTVRGWKALVEWLIEAGAPGSEELAKPAWQDPAWKATPEATKRFETIFTEFAQDKLKQDLYIEAQRRGIAMCPVNDVDGALNDPQLIEREFFQEVRIGPDGAPMLLPGPPYRLSRTPASLATKVPEFNNDA